MRRHGRGGSGGEGWKGWGRETDRDSGHNGCFMEPELAWTQVMDMEIITWGVIRADGTVGFGEGTGDVIAVWRAALYEQKSGRRSDAFFRP